MRKPTTILAVASVWLLLQGISSAANPKPSISITITAVSNPLRIGSPLRLDAVMKNVSHRDILVWRNASGPELVYKVEIRDDNGSIPPETKFRRDLRGLEDPRYLTPDTPIGFSGGWVPIKAGKTLADPINVSRLYDLINPGNYTVQVKRLDQESETFVSSNVITVIVIR